jgi:nitronate monooxygenase
MPVRTSFSERFSLQIPVIQAPMAGGGDTVELVAAVSNAGGLGTFGGAYLTPEQIEQRGQAIRTLTPKPFGVNLFAPMPEPAVGDEQRSIERLRPYYAELGIEPPKSLSLPSYTFDDQLEAALSTGAQVFSFTFGNLSSDVVSRIKSRGMYVLGTATTVDEAIALEKNGVDAVVAQGAEAGGHRGTFNSDFDSGLVGTMALVPQVVDAVRTPVIASGGIMDGRGVAAALVLGAEAAQLGTAFLVCDEAGAPEAYKQAILDARESETRVTRAFSGRPARGIINSFMTEIGDDVPPFPIQNSLTRPLRNEAAKRGRIEFLNLWSGQGTRLARKQSAAKLMSEIEAELKAVLSNIAKIAG